MEQAVNQFYKGLLSDTHPMVLGNDVLSDALNATFMTMNGNEVVLQNDMGNRRVDNAYLPSGYEPVGIKEYGGIIYIAAYNPITNKSQIGSFPSPERKISSNDLSNLGGTLNLDDLLTNYNDLNLGINCIYKDTILVPLTTDTSLHAGDKFVVYCTNLTDTDKISNYDNVSGDKVTSPKNRQYTLALGILNSQNEFVDVTKTLVRWKDSTIINYDGQNKSDLYKFNDGYFIAKSYNPPTMDETKDDAELLQERQVITANTYAYKLVGPLYIKATLNHIKDFSYNLYGTYDSDSKTAKIWIESFITYNCPDGLTEGDGSDLNYKTYAEGEPKSFTAFDLYIEGEKQDTDTDPVPGKTKYDPNTDLYTCKIVKPYKIENKTSFDYVIGVRAVDNKVDNKYLYLAGLSTKGNIDVTLFGSGKVILKGWRFINDYTNRSSTITYNFDAYPEYGKSFLNLVFTFKDVKGGDEHKISGTIYNGRNTLNINWDQNELEPNKMYRVTWTYDIITDTTEEKTSNTKTVSSEKNTDTKQTDRWLLTTELFNDCYSSNSSNYIQDYGNPTNSNSDKEGSEATEVTPEEEIKKDTEEGIMLRKELIPYSINPNITDSSLPANTTVDKPIVLESDVITVTYTTTKNIILNLSPTIEYNSQLYPDYIQVLSDIQEYIEFTRKTKDEEGKEVDMKDDCSGTMDYEITTEDSRISKPSELKPKFDWDEATTSNKLIKGTLTNYDYYQCLGQNNSTITNGFASIHKLLDDQIGKNNNNTFSKGMINKYSMIFLDYDSHAGSGDEHFLRTDVNSELESRRKLGKNSPRNDDTMTTIDRERCDRRVDFTMKEFKSEIFAQFDNISNKFLFTWAFYGSASDGKDNVCLNTTNARNQGPDGKVYARVWWRTSYDDWALFPSPMHWDDTLHAYKFFNNFFSTDFKFAYYTKTTLADINKYLPDQKNYCKSSEYSFIYTMNWGLSTKANKSTEIVFTKDETSGINCRYPKFKTNTLTLDISYDFNVKTSDEYLDMLDTLTKLTKEIDGIDVDTGMIADFNGNPLNSNNVYKIDNTTNKLVLWQTSKFLVTDKYGGSPSNNYTCRGIVYNDDTTGKPNYQYDVTGNNNDNHTVLNYDSVNIVRI